MDGLADHGFVVDDQDLLRGCHGLVGADGKPWSGPCGRLGAWQRDREHRALPVAAAHVDVTTKHGHQATYDVQPQSSPGGTAHNRIVGAIKLLEEPGHMFLADSDTLV